MTSSPPLILRTDIEHLDGLKFLCGDGLLADIKQQLVPIALNVIRDSLVGHAHRFETLQSFSDTHWQDLIVNPQSPSALGQLLDAVELHPRLKGVVEILHHPSVMQRLRIEWLHEMTIGRFEHSVRFLRNEEDLLKDWQHFCGELRDFSINPFDVANQEVQQRLSSCDTLSASAQALYRLSFLAACRKLFVHFSGAKETWAGAYTIHSFKLAGTLADQIGRTEQDSQIGSGLLSLRFGQVDHVFYLKPSLEQLQLYQDCIKDPNLPTSVQRKLCPFISTDNEELNFLAEVFYRVYLPGCLRDMHKSSPAKPDEDFLRDSGMKMEFFRRFRFLSLSAETTTTLSEKMDELQRLRAFLHHPHIETGLVRQRLFRGILEPMLADVTQKSLLFLCRRWNPLLRTEEGATLLLINCVESKVSRVIDDDPKAALLKQRLMVDELAKILDRNTQSWQAAFAKDGFVVDRARDYFMTVLDKAIEEARSEQARCTRYQDFRRVARVVVE